VYHGIHFKKAGNLEIIIKLTSKNIILPIITSEGNESLEWHPNLLKYFSRYQKTQKTLTIKIPSTNHAEGIF